jgi:predicted ATPase
MQAEVDFAASGHSSCHRMTLADAAPDTLIFTHEAVRYHRKSYPRPQEIVLGAGHRESRLKESADNGDRTCKVIYGMFTGCRTYQFHDTSETAKIRKAGYIEDAGYLRSDGGNLAAFLLAMRQTSPNTTTASFKQFRRCFRSSTTSFWSPALATKATFC